MFRLAPLLLLAALPKTASAQFVAEHVEQGRIAGELGRIYSLERIQLGEQHLNGNDLCWIRRMSAQTASVEPRPKVILSNGDILIGSAVEGDESRLLVQSDSLKRFSVPIEFIRAIVFEGEFRDSPADASEDRLVLANGDELRGLFTRLDKDHLYIETNRSEVAVERSRIRQLFFNDGLLEPLQVSQLSARLVLANGTSITVSKAESNREFLRAEALFGISFEIAQTQVELIEFSNGRALYLSTLAAASYEHVPLFRLSFPYRQDRSVGGNPIRLGRQEYRRGLGMHSRSRLTYEIPNGVDRFSALVGVDDETGGRGSVRFRVLLDGREAFSSEVLRGHDRPQKVDVRTSGARTITLAVEDADNLNIQDHADWAEARFVQTR